MRASKREGPEQCPGPSLQWRKYYPRHACGIGSAHRGSAGSVASGYSGLVGCTGGSVGFVGSTGFVGCTGGSVGFVGSTGFVGCTCGSVGFVGGVGSVGPTVGTTGVVGLGVGSLRGSGGIVVSGTHSGCAFRNATCCSSDSVRNTLQVLARSDGETGGIDRLIGGDLRGGGCQSKGRSAARAACRPPLTRENNPIVTTDVFLNLPLIMDAPSQSELPHVEFLVETSSLISNIPII